LLADLWLIHDVRSAKLDQLFHIVLDQLSRSAQLSRLNIPGKLMLVLDMVITVIRFDENCITNLLVCCCP